MVIHHQKKWPIPASILFHWTNCQLLHLRRSEIQGFTGFNQPGNLPADAQCCSPVTPTSTAICCTAQPWIEFSPCTKPHSSARSISFNVQCRWHALLSCPLPMWTLNVYNFCNIICTCTYIYIYTQYFFLFLRCLHFFWSVFFQIPCGHTDGSHVWHRPLGLIPVSWQVSSASLWLCGCKPRGRLSCVSSPCSSPVPTKRPWRRRNPQNIISPAISNYFWW